MENLEVRFKYHPPKTPEDVVKHEKIRDVLHMAARYILDLVPEGREQSLAISKLEEAMFWSNAGIARSRVE